MIYLWLLEAIFKDVRPSMDNGEIALEVWVDLRVSYSQGNAQSSLIEEKHFRSPTSTRYIRKKLFFLILPNIS